jgi:hypothetical protein
MWIPFAFIFIGMAGMPQGSYDWAELPLLMRTSTIITGILGFASISLILGASLVSWLQNRSVLASGEPATATILNIKPTGETVNDYYLRMSFTLEVRSLSETFQAITEKYVPMHDLTKYQIGMKVNVKYSPHNRTVAMID